MFLIQDVVIQTVHFLEDNLNLQLLLIPNVHLMYIPKVFLSKGNSEKLMKACLSGLSFLDNQAV